METQIFTYIYRDSGLDHTRTLAGHIALERPGYNYLDWKAILTLHTKGMVDRLRRAYDKHGWKKFIQTLEAAE